MRAGNTFGVEDAPGNATMLVIDAIASTGLHSFQPRASTTIPVRRGMAREAERMIARPFASRGALACEQRHLLNGACTPSVRWKALNPSLRSRGKRPAKLS